MSYEKLTMMESPNDIIHEVEKRRGALFEADMFRTNEAIADFGVRVKERYGEDFCNKVRAYNALIMSGIPPGFADKDDFPEDDSVLKFLSNLEREFSQ